MPDGCSFVVEGRVVRKRKRFKVLWSILLITEWKEVTRKSVVVVGAGVGGIHAAAKLAKHGYQVTVVEKNRQAGGRCNFFERDGYSFDTGPTILMMPEIYARAFSDLGERMGDHLELLRIEPTYHIYFDNGTELAITSDQKMMREQLEAIEPSSFMALQRYLKEGEFFYKLAVPNFIDRDFRNFLEYFNPRNLYLAFKLKALINHYKYVAKFFSDRRLKEAFTFRDAYLGLNPYEASAMFSMLQYLELAKGVWLPRGGMYSFVKAMTRLAEKFGAKFIYGTPVKQINVKRDKVVSVTSADGEKFDADIMVANADLTYVYQHLLPNDKVAKGLMRKKYTCSAITFYWGIDKQYSQLGTHNLFVSGDYRKSFRQVTKDLSLPDDPSFYVHTPTRVDPSRAPRGCDTIMVVVPVGHIRDAAPQNWIDLQNKARKRVIRRLAAIGATDIEKHIKFEVSYTAEDWVRLYNLTKGSTLGLGHNLTQMCYLRPKNRHKHYHNLYFVGSSTHPGSGVPTVLISARLTSERILEESS